MAKTMKSKRAGTLAKPRTRLTTAKIEKMEKSKNPRTRRRATLAETVEKDRD